MGSPSGHDNQSHYLPSEHYPWIVFPCDFHPRNQIFCSLSHPHKIFQKSIPELIDSARVVVRCSDWLLLIKGDTNSHYSLWNLTIPNSIKLPLISLKSNSEVDCWALSSPPGGCDPKSCKVLLFDKANRSIIFIRPDVEYKRWIELPYGQLLRDIGVAADDEEEEDYLRQCVSCNGKLYAMSFHSSRVVIIDVDRDDHLIIESLPCVLPNLGSYGIHYCEFLADLEDELYLIRIFYGGMLQVINEVIDVVIFKLDFSSMVWNKVRDLSGGTFFFDGYHVSSATTLGNQIVCDSIYFTMPQDKGWFYCFNMKDCSLQVNLPCPISATSCFCPMFFMPPSNVRLSNNHTHVVNKSCKGKQVAKCTVKVQEKEDSMKETEVPTTFNDLPVLAMKLISDSLNLFDYNLNFRALSRVCRSAAPKLERNQALEKLEGSPLCPWLLFPTNLTTHNFIDPKHAYRFLMTFPESLVKSQVRCLKQSWMMMSDCENSVSFYNPFTKATVDIDIPANQHPVRFSNSHVMGFSTMPTSPGCMVVGFSDISLHGILVSLAVMRHGEFEWHTFGLECQFSMSQGCPVFFDGIFYVLGQEGNLLAFRCGVEGNEVDNIQWYIIDSKIPFESYQKSYILEWDSQLACIFVGPMGTWVRVFKFSTTTFSLQSVENLGDDAFFVSQSSCLAMEARSLGMQNRIYFPRVRGNSILYYSLETRKFHYDMEDYLDDFHNTKEQLRSGWFDPRFF